MFTKDTKDTKIKDINVHFWIIFNIAVCAIMNDYTVYITGINYGISLILSSIILIIVNFFIIKNKLITIKSDFEWFDLAFIVLTICYTILKISTPDYTYDTVNYHIYLQENIRIDKIYFDFFAGKNINGFLFPLADRINYIARYILGYRLGTIFSFYSIIAIFYQTKRILNYITGKRKLNSLLAILCWSSFILRLWTGTYYIDIFSVLFTLTILQFLLKEKDCFKNKYKLFALAALTGILTGIKLPNIILIFPILLIFLVKRHKQLKLKNIPVYLISILIFIIPFIIYLIDNFIQTGSPLYPYYNNIFKSEYFGYYSWVEPLFGIPNWKYKLIWPIYTSLSRDGYGDNSITLDPVWAIGYVVTILYFIYGTIRWKKHDKTLYLLSVISLINTFLWIQFLYGYMRYGLIIPVLYSIIIACLINKCLYFIRRKKLNLLPQRIFIVLGVLYSIFLVWISLLINFTGLNFNKLLGNYKLMFRDRNGVTIHLNDNSAWGVTADDSGLTQIVREDGVPIYNLQHWIFNSSEKTKQQYNEIINNDKDIYVLITLDTYNRKLEYLRASGLSLDFVREYSSDEIPYLDVENRVYLYKIRK